MSHAVIPGKCQHRKLDGTMCRAIALKGKRYCYFHDQARLQSARIAVEPQGQARFKVPVLDGAHGIQLALMQVLELLSLLPFDHKTASLILYALQTASGNLKRPEFAWVEPDGDEDGSLAETLLKRLFPNGTGEEASGEQFVEAGDAQPDLADNLGGSLASDLPRIVMP